MAMLRIRSHFYGIRIHGSVIEKSNPDPDMDPTYTNMPFLFSVKIQPFFTLLMSLKIKNKK